MRTLLVFCASLLTATAQAGVGIGASVRSDDAAIYLPIETSSKFMVEPYLDYADQTDKLSATRITTKTTTIGVGIFRMASPEQKFSIYYGARLAYLRQETSRAVAGFMGGGPVPFGPVPIGGGYVVAYPIGGIGPVVDGYSVAPTLGFQYHVLDRLTIGAEIAAQYSDVSGQIVSGVPTGTAIETKQRRTRTETRTNVIFRFFFK